MALDYLFKCVIEDEIEIAVHPEATHLRCEKGEIKQYKCNPMPLDSMRKIPKGSNTLKFINYFPSSKHIEYGRIQYISHRGNILKEERY